MQVPPSTKKFQHSVCWLIGTALFFLIPGLPIIALCWDDDLMTMKFIQAEVECASSPIFTSRAIWPSGQMVSPLNPTRWWWRNQFGSLISCADITNNAHTNLRGISTVNVYPMHKVSAHFNFDDHRALRPVFFTQRWERHCYLRREALGNPGLGHSFPWLDHQYSQSFFLLDPFHLFAFSLHASFFLVLGRLKCRIRDVKGFFLHMSKADRDHLHRCLISAFLLDFQVASSLVLTFRYWLVAREERADVTGSFLPNLSNTPPSFRGLGCGEGDLFFLSLLNTLACGDGLREYLPPCLFRGSVRAVGVLDSE
ncbi:hypothetical protein Tco_0502637 [Tanacetum coccineum]